MLKNTIKGSNDPYVKKTFPNFIKELQKNPELALDPNVWKQFTTGLPKNQRLVVHSDDSVDFFRQTEFGPHNIENITAFQKKHPFLTHEQATKITKMEPEDQVLEVTRQERIYDQNLIQKNKDRIQRLREKGYFDKAEGGIAGELHLNRPGYAGGKSTFPKQLSLFERPKIGDALKKLSDAELKRQMRAMARKWGVPMPKASGGLAHVLGV
jgi:hypothetical protein